MLLSIQNVSYHVAGRSILEDVSLQLPESHRSALVGRNGSGKSSLFKIILGLMQPDSGTAEIGRGCRVMAVKQEMPGGEMTPLEFLLAADEERVALFKELETPDLAPDRMGDIYERLMQIDAYDAEARAATVLKGLGFDDEAQNRPLGSFSGGYRMRVALAAILYQQPDLLLLDEPTNHLDLETTLWLQEFLRKYPKSFLLISHDRDFLNATVESIFHLKSGKVTRYSGNFDNFIRLYKEQQAFASAHNTKMQAKKEHMMAFINRFKAKASKARQAQSRLKAVEKMEFLPVDEAESVISLNFPDVEALAPPLITYDRVNLGYGDRIILKRLSGTLGPDDRIALLGHNGNGKTTFARFLGGDLAPLQGERFSNPKLKIGYYHQDQFESLELNRTPLNIIGDVLPKASETQVRSHLGRFGFSRERAAQKIGQLSGGERARLVFSRITAELPNVLILDEPTNHLDMEMREALIMSINAFRGAVILITHDRHLLRHTADRLWLVADQTVKLFEGTIEDYYNLIA